MLSLLVVLFLLIHCLLLLPLFVGVLICFVMQYLVSFPFFQIILTYYLCILIKKRELVATLNFSSWCLVPVIVSSGAGLQCCWSAVCEWCIFLTYSITLFYDNDSACKIYLSCQVTMAAVIS